MLERDLFGLRVVADLGQQHDELVAAEPGDHAGLRENGADPVRDLLEQQVAVVMAERVVHVLEAVEVHQHHCDAPTAGAALAQRVVGPGDEEITVAEAGQRVVERLVLLLRHLGSEPFDQAARSRSRCRRGARASRTP